ncbi:ATP-binding cassette domain-containing protein [Paenibacillus sp. GSMTC-2017]|uniref:methionine ABC transporter ATP-binding protein n=1 Tax=Paenibacillus sp. GSMTC-2017 TaxID=2794350 RepID=UPI0018D7D507|nr:ATP-binding cassette domain-containing protein [Paenibacillus sp. GSMTC-2017]MBH5319079.1 ATP-binding cassette domain-containing protein [Paenibacillus sp. GSMTC-2017]
MIELIDINKQYRRSDKSYFHALSGINLKIEKGEIFGVIGRSGAGKSTLLRSVNLLERPSSGTVIVGDNNLMLLKEKELQDRRKQIGMIFQHFNLLSTATVRDNIAFPLKISKKSSNEIAVRVDELLELVGLTNHQHQYPRQLSGGQKQRVGIARALANEPDVLLCDEATSALDPETTDSILTLLRDINRKMGITILLITHEMDVIRAVCDRVAVMDHGQIVESGTVLDIFLNPTNKVTKQFVSEVFDTLGEETFGARQTQGKIVRIAFRGEQTYEPILYEAVRGTDATFAILQGTVSKMKDTPYGQLVVELRGSNADVSRIIAELGQRGLGVSEL